MTLNLRPHKMEIPPKSELTKTRLVRGRLMSRREGDRERTKVRALC